MPIHVKRTASTLLERMSLNPDAPVFDRAAVFNLAADICERYGENLETIMVLNKLEDAVRWIAAAAKRKGE